MGAWNKKKHTIAIHDSLKYDIIRCYYSSEIKTQPVQKIRKHVQQDIKEKDLKRITYSYSKAQLVAPGLLQFDSLGVET